MATKKSEPIQYQALSEELETILTALQTDTLDIDQALVQYQRGLEIVGLLETYLEQAENKIVTLKANFETDI